MRNNDQIGHRKTTLVNAIKHFNSAISKYQKQSIERSKAIRRLIVIILFCWIVSFMTYVWTLLVLLR